MSKKAYLFVLILSVLLLLFSIRGIVKLSLLYGEFDIHDPLTLIWCVMGIISISLIVISVIKIKK